MGERLAVAAAHFSIERARLGSEEGPARPAGWQAKFYGGNGELVWLTEVYTSKENALNAVSLLKGEVAHAAVELESEDAL